MKKISIKEQRKLSKGEALEIIKNIYWDDGAVCPQCQNPESYKLTGKSTHPSV